MRNASYRKRKRKGAARNGVKTMDIILFVTVILLIAFTVTMIVIFKTQGAIPDTLCTCFFATFGGECGIMGWIQTTKTKYKDREWEKEDRELERKEREEAENDG